MGSPLLLPARRHPKRNAANSGSDSEDWIFAAVRVMDRNGDAGVGSVHTVVILVITAAALPLYFAVACVCSVRNLVRSISDALLGRRTGTSHRTVLITGASTPAGLHVARVLSRAGIRVVAAEYERSAFSLSCSRFSNAVYRHYRLYLSTGRMGVEDPGRVLLEQLKSIIKREEVVLWIPCHTYSDPATLALVKQLVESETTCKILHPTSEELEIMLDENLVQDRLPDLAPHTETVKSRNEIHRKLHEAPEGQRFVVHRSPIGRKIVHWDIREDSSPPDSPISTAPTSVDSTPTKSSGNGINGTIIKPAVLPSTDQQISSTWLPLATVNETYAHVATIPVSKTRPYILREVIEGKPYLIHTLIVCGKLRSFVATTSNETVSHSSSNDCENYFSPRGMALATSSPILHDALLKATKALVSKLPERLSAHLAIGAVVSECTDAQGRICQRVSIVSLKPSLTAISTLAPFEETQAAELAEAYLDVAGGSQHMNGNGSPKTNGAIMALAARSGYMNGHAKTSSTSSTSSTNSNSTSSSTSNSHRPLITPAPSLLSPTTATTTTGSYSLPPLFLLHIYAPLLSLLLCSDDTSFSSVLQHISAFLVRVAAWREELWDSTDPWPWVWKWGVLWAECLVWEVVLGVLGAVG
ncbi:hypothetical protein K402DRAFT_399114 [Aulographum hederae CBS 113979]|uniref:Uncharacterized protein n=1 Tax=Aulographum hederae CBS 113979 TaxID=1176131 RepID=A0A6G1GJ70_9PEZI|nr:hypothetical protein K402DRAFT_399114 [Aulographum hederae CBS 113979]